MSLSSPEAEYHCHRSAKTRDKRQRLQRGLAAIKAAISAICDATYSAALNNLVCKHAPRLQGGF